MTKGPQLICGPFTFGGRDLSGADDNIRAGARVLSVCQKSAKQEDEVCPHTAPAGNAECNEAGGESGIIHAESFGRSEEEECSGKACAGSGCHSLQETLLQRGLRQDIVRPAPRARAKAVR